jgi:hypothetical protein
MTSKSSEGYKSGTVGWPTVPDSSGKVKKGPCKNLASLDLESGTIFLANKGKKRDYLLGMKNLLCL